MCRHRYRFAHDGSLRSELTGTRGRLRVELQRLGRGRCPCLAGNALRSRAGSNTRLAGRVILERIDSGIFGHRGGNHRFGRGRSAIGSLWAIGRLGWAALRPNSLLGLNRILNRSGCMCVVVLGFNTTSGFYATFWFYATGWFRTTAGLDSTGWF